MSTEAAARHEHLVTACEHYEAAHRGRLVGQRPAADAESWSADVEAYYALNWIQLAKLARVRVNAREVTATLAAVESSTPLLVTGDGRLDRRAKDAVPGAPEEGEEDFWSRSCTGDLALTRYVLRPGHSAAEQVEKAYSGAFELRSSRNNRDSVLDHLSDLAALADDAELEAISRRLQHGADALAPVVSAPRSAASAPTTRRRAKAAGRSPIVVDALPVAHGDSLVVTYGDGAHRILIDGGPAHSYDGALRAHLSALDADLRRFELFVVTHIDADHIDGSVILLQELEPLEVKIDEVWFNGWPQIASRGAEQGEFLDTLLPHERWNTRFSGKAVSLGSNGKLPEAVKLPGGAVLTLLSPDQAGLRKLATSWEKAVHDAGATPGDDAEFRRRLAARKIYQPPSSRGGGAKLGADNAVANGSSIAFLFEDGDRSCLFTGDAHAGVLTASLQQLAAERGVERVPVGLMKLSHHGSQQNISPELLRSIDCRRFLISTNGAIFQHPDPSSLELLAGEVGDCEVIFNYKNETVTRWEKVLPKALLGKINAVYPSDGEVTTVTV
jgi:beta-lactamase superfamily II metal-dependent hydrolase